MLVSKIDFLKMFDSTPAELVRCATSQDCHIREMAAINPNTPQSVLLSLAHDQSWQVRRNLALNPLAPVEALRMLALSLDEADATLTAVACHPRTQPEMLSRLSDPFYSHDVRLSVARNLNTPHDTLAMLADQDCDELAAAVEDNLGMHRKYPDSFSGLTSYRH